MSSAKKLPRARESFTVAATVFDRRAGKAKALSPGKGEGLFILCLLFGPGAEHLLSEAKKLPAFFDPLFMLRMKERKGRDDAKRVKTKGNGFHRSLSL